jgi:hypothetical protein
MGRTELLSLKQKKNPHKLNDEDSSKGDSTLPHNCGYHLLGQTTTFSVRDGGEPSVFPVRGYNLTGNYSNVVYIVLYKLVSWP